MGNLISLLFVVLVMVLAIGAVYAITASGSAMDAPTDTFGNTAPAQTVAQNENSSNIAVQTLPVIFIAFFIMICVVLAAGFAWFWKTGKSKASSY